MQTGARRPLQHVFDQTLRRLRADDELANLSMLAAFTVSAIMGMAVLRLVRGELAVALLDTGIAAAIAGVVIYAWRTGDSARAGLALVIVHSLGCALVVALFGGHGLYWTYLVVVTNYFLVAPNRAFIAGALLIALASFVLVSAQTSVESVSFLITVMLVSGFTWLFAKRTARQRHWLEQKATHDALTGVGNRRLMEVEIARAASAGARSKARYALAIMDLDHFKAVNDGFGHEAGDRVLVSFARMVESHTRSQDRLFRLGGEEFVLLLHDVDREGLMHACEKLREQVQAELGIPGLHLTVSIGACVLLPGDDAGRWLARADAALYQAKREGRNRTVIA